MKFFAGIVAFAVLLTSGIADERTTSRTAFTQTTATLQDASSPYADLKKSILDGYDPEARPGNPDEPILVQMGLIVNAMQVEEWNIALHSDSFVIMEWQDNRLTWDPSTFSGIESISLNPTSVWLPDIQLWNSIPSFSSALQAMQYKVLVQSNGTVVWVPSVSLKSACPLDLVKFPQDRHRCVMIFGSWTHDKSQIDLQLSKEPIKTDNFVTTSPWYIKASYAEEKDESFPGIAGKWPSLRFVFYMRRRVTPFCIILYTPVFVCVLAALSSIFLWRCHSGFGSVIVSLMNTAILTGVVAHHYIYMRVSGCGVPCIMKFIGSLMALEAMIIPLKATLANLMADVRGESEKTAKPLPKSLAALINLPGMLRRKAKGESDEDFLLASERDKKNYEDWNRARSVMGFLIMVVYVIGLATAGMMFLVPLLFDAEE